MAKRKRAAGEGTLSRKKNGTWQCQIMVGYKADGKRDIRTFSAKSQREALQKRDDFLRKKEAGLLTGKDIRFDELAIQWYNFHCESVSPTTAEGYRYTLRILTDYFGHQKASNIRASDVEKFLISLKKEGRSDSYIAKCRALLHAIMRRAVANDYLLKNPVEFAEKMRKRGVPRRKEAFTADEVRYLMENLPENKIGWSIRLLLSTGIRSGELLALEPRHISIDGTFVTIEQSLVRLRGSVGIGPPKSWDSYRTVPVPPMTQYCARALRETTDKFIWNSPKKADQPCNPSHFSDLFKKTLEQMEGVRVMTPHCCRHTYVSQLQALGVSVETIQSLCGHAEVDTTRHYLHVQDNIRLEAVDRFSEAFSRKGRGTFGNVLDYVKSS